MENLTAEQILEGDNKMETEEEKEQFLNRHLSKIKTIQANITQSIMTTDQIKDTEAIKLGYNSFRDLVLNPKQDMSMEHLKICVHNSMENYANHKAEQAIQEVLKRAAENAEIVQTVAYVRSQKIDTKRYKSENYSADGIMRNVKVDQDSILNTEYKDLLK